MTSVSASMFVSSVTLPLLTLRNGCVRFMTLQVYWSQLACHLADVSREFVSDSCNNT